MRKEWYVLQAFSGMENKVKELIIEKSKVLDLDRYIGRIIVPEIEELDYSNRKVEKIFVSQDSTIYVKKGKDVKKGDIIAKNPETTIKHSGVIKEMKNYRRIIVETKGKKYSKTFLIPESAKVLSGLRIGKTVKPGMPFTNDGSYECDVEGEIGTVEKVKRIIVENSNSEEDVYIVPVKLFDSRTYKTGVEVSEGEAIASGKEFKSKSSGRVDIKDMPLRKEIRIIKTSRKKLFPGYIFIEMMHVKEVEKMIVNIPYVSSFLNVGGRPLKLKRKEIRVILRLIGEEEYDSAKPRKEIRTDYELGEHVKIISGPFEFFTGKIKSIDLEKQEVKVSVSMFGRETEVELGLTEIEKIVD
ncbi:transcription termination/antitermination NusG family protein [Geotoga petraea]|jgi:transcriptional antiterminator NusG|uniref:Transcription termination/antitermination protein NusG n=1 Tax=Geotoga petraea TaxID=28234 RepID=A0A1G6HZ67_9BACT|nr:transcription termination/antitermination NusG family protein [Geotoga petraea]MDK2945369.1 transcription termination/antitermination protein NusG [Geotoga sp.]TGG89030.1 antitermination protein NusG [Geotoga petraea]SDB99511.1 transcription antitermination protein nusG [Geotoga petraea]